MYFVISLHNEFELNGKHFITDFITSLHSYPQNKKRNLRYIYGARAALSLSDLLQTTLINGSNEN